MGKITKFFYVLIFRFSKNFSNSMDMTKLKKFSDFSFVITEKIIVNFGKLLPFYLDFYEEMVNKEIMIADISSDDNVLHIGCGPIPATSILITMKTKAKVTAIDKIYNYFKKANYLVKNFYKLDYLNVKCADGLNFPMMDYDVIILSDGIDKINEILFKISKTADKGTRVIIRKKISLNKSNFDNSDLINLFEIKELKHHESYGNFSSILLIKKEN